MADINDLAQQIAYYQAGGNAPGKSPGEQFIQGANNALALGRGVEDIIKQRLEAKKLALAQKPVGEYFGVPSQAEVTKQQALSAESQKNYDQAKGSFYQNNPLPAQGPETYQAESQMLASKPAPYVDPRKAFQDTYHISPDAPTEEAKTLMTVAQSAGSIPVFYNAASKATHFTWEPGDTFLGVFDKNKALGVAAGKEKASLSAESADSRQAKGFDQQVKMEGIKNTDLQNREQMRVDPMTRDKVLQIENNVDLAKNVLNGLNAAQKAGIRLTGFGADWERAAKERSVGLSPEETQAITALRSNFAKFARQMGGTAFTPTEREIFAPIVPQEGIEMGVNAGRIKENIREMQNLLGGYNKRFPGLSRYGGPADTGQGSALTTEEAAFIADYEKKHAIKP